MKYIRLFLTLMIVVLASSDTSACDVLERIEKNWYNNVLDNIQTKIIDVNSSKIRDRVRNVTYEVLPFANITNLDETLHNDTICKKDSVSVKDMIYGKSILCNTENKITYNLDGKYSYFTSYVSVCDVDAQLVEENVKGVNIKLPHPVGEVMFSVFVDDVLVYFSSVMNSHSLPEYVHVDVSGKQKLVLVVENIESDDIVKTVWLEPTLYKNKISTVPCTLKYKKQPGTFLYCNNPESIKMEDTLDNGKIIYTASDVYGDVCLFAEQNNSTGDDMYYGVVVENDTLEKASVLVKNIGESKNWWTGLKADENCWQNFYNSSGCSIEVLPNESAWLVCPILLSCYNQYTGEGVLNLAMHFEVDVPIKISVVAFSKDYKLESAADVCGIYQGYVIRRENYWGEARNYKGKCNNYPKQECSIRWEIDDNTKEGYLPVRYNNLDRSGWITHITKNKHTSAMGTDMYTFVDPNGLCFGHDTKDYSTMISNLGNWAVLYKEVYEIKNNSDKERSIDIMMKNAFINSGVIVITPDGSIIKSASSDDNIKKIATLKVKAKDTTQHELEYMIPACSTGGLAHYVKLI